MDSSFGGLRFGLLFAIVLVYLLMVVNFQSWLDPFIILMALPGALAGIVWILFLTGTTLSVPALIGSIMCVGVATSNSILVVSFANDQREHGRDARGAALAVGHDAPAAGDHDRARDDHRHVADGDSGSARAASKTRRSAAR